MARKAPISTLEDLQRLVPSIVKTVNADQALMRRALVNPLLALEELGYHLSDELRPQIERRVRFKVEVAHKLDTLAGKVFKQAGEPFDIDSPAALEKVLFDKLKLPRAEGVAGKRDTRAAPALTPSAFKQPVADDPLERLRGTHAVMAPLLEYRKLEASEPRLAPRELYERVRSGEVKLPVLRARARLQRGPTPQ